MEHHSKYKQTRGAACISMQWKSVFRNKLGLFRGHIAKDWMVKVVDANKQHYDHHRQPETQVGSKVLVKRLHLVGDTW